MPLWGIFGENKGLAGFPSVSIHPSDIFSESFQAVGSYNTCAVHIAIIDRVSPNTLLYTIPEAPIAIS
jgi:hypothetical protein